MNIGLHGKKNSIASSDSREKLRTYWCLYMDCIPDYCCTKCGCLAEELLQLLNFSAAYIICWYSVQGYRSACVCGNYFTSLCQADWAEAKATKLTCGLQASVAVLFIMKKVQCSLLFVFGLFFCPYVLCKNWVTERKGGFVITIAEAPLPSSGATRRLQVGLHTVWQNHAIWSMDELCWNVFLLR